MNSKLKLAILFGSRAKGHAGKMSDTDIAILADHELTLRDKITLAEKFGSRLGVSEDEIDVVDLRIASPLLQHEVTTHGKLLEGDPEDFFQFRVLAWKRYQDTAKFRKIRNKHLTKLLHV